MRILLVGNYALDHQTSMLRYSEMLQTQLSGRGHVAELIRPAPLFGRLSGRRTLRKWLGYLDKFLIFPWQLRRLSAGFDLVHICDHSNSMYLAHRPKQAASITCHDLLAVAAARGVYAGQHTSWTGKVLQRWIVANLARASHVVSVSSATAAEFKRLVPAFAGEVVVIPNPLHFPFAPATEAAVEEVHKRLGLAHGEPYLMHVGGNHWYKNRMGVLRLYARVRCLLTEHGAVLPRMVMVGEGFSREMRQFVERNDLTHFVSEQVGVSDEELCACYTGALALLFPSLYEGFGWPVVEAQSCGCPVLCSNRASLPEVAGDAAIYLEVDREEEAAKLIADSLGTLPALRQAGFENARRFTPEKILPQYESFFANAVRKHEAEQHGVERAQ
jgi:glycosyltransferase involved in cell wall biosynthesis